MRRWCGNSASRPLYKLFISRLARREFWGVPRSVQLQNFSPRALKEKTILCFIQKISSWQEACAVCSTCMVLSGNLLFSSLTPVLLHNAIPFVGFGFLDNAIMIAAVSNHVFVYISVIQNIPRYSDPRSASDQITVTELLRLQIIRSFQLRISLINKTKP